MISHTLKSYFPDLTIRQKQTNNIIFITFWSQFAVYALNTVLILRPFNREVQQRL